jgi:hypothetical protein
MPFASVAGCWPKAATRIGIENQPLRRPQMLLPCCKGSTYVLSHALATPTIAPRSAPLLDRSGAQVHRLECSDTGSPAECTGRDQA